MGRWGCGSTVTPDNSSWGVGAAVPLWNFEVASKVEAFGDIARHLTSDELGAREFLTSVNPRAQRRERERDFLTLHSRNRPLVPCAALVTRRVKRRG